MILIGKAKEDFEKFIKYNNCDLWDAETYTINLEDVFYRLPESMKHSFIIEWFDSVDININTTPFDYQVIYENKEYNCYKNIVDYNRTEVTIFAIEKANEIYNYRFNLNLNK